MAVTATTTATEDSPLKLTLAYDKEIHEEVRYVSHSLPSPISDLCPQYKYSAYLPVYDEETHFPPLQPFKFNDHGLAANKEKPNLLSRDNASLQVTKLTPGVGTEIRGLQLSQLSDVQKDELALLIAERGVVVFRDQDFKDIGIEKQKEFGQYFGPLHIHVCPPIHPSRILHPHNP